MIYKYITRNIMSPFYTLLLLQLFILNSFLALNIRRSEGKRNFVLKTPELIRSHGYQVEIHNVITEDGYILEIHRLSCGRLDCERNFTNGKQPILMQHGLAGSSADWVFMGPNRALAYMLANAGYDVWLGNNRGNTYSRNHILMLPQSRHFWNFSYHELGIYDVPATIDYILDQTNYEQLFYIGHSQGTTQFWVAMSQRPDYNAKIKLMIGLAPVAFTGNIRGPITKLAKLTYLGVMNLTTIINYVPAGASWKQMVHFGQGYIHPQSFRQFDYHNKEKNYQIYNSLEPPKYKLNEVTAPVAFFSSDNDLLSTKSDVDLLKSKLNNVVFHKEVSIKSFSHYDFIWGTSSVSIIFEPILDLLVLNE
ncbi:lipase 1-like isoform X2 [Frieseomelitta varia]|uniref:lipase 1-like isoform X2 n=1 Tax=Frieseomelitta varia TaxID=561572 RepID=UPI001CB6873F|nr:lipase 1-like isoform X2 [Frieseomelitta varia]